MPPNYPTSDLQFLAQVIQRVHAGDQITASDRHRLDEIAGNGYSIQQIAAEPQIHLHEGQPIAAEPGGGSPHGV